MPIRKYKPTTPGRRGASVADFAEITRSTPEKSLLAPLHGRGGRNVHGRITARHQGDRVESGPGADIKPGNNLPLRNIPVGTTIHAVELRPGGGAKLARSAGVGIQLLGREGDYATLRMPSGEIRRVSVSCRATVGEIGNADQSNLSWGKAGRLRWKGKRPSVRGVAMNPVVNPHGKPEGRTRRKGQPSDRLIVRRRYANRKRG